MLVTDATGAAALTYRVGIYGISRGTGAGADGRLVNLGRRWLDPALGRFISSDPIVVHGFTLDAWNPYVFAHNNPIAFADPSGCDGWDVLAVIGVAVVVAALVAVSVLTGVGVITMPFLVSLGWGTIAATAAGVAGGAAVGGIAAARAGGSIAAGVLLGGLVGGAGALAGGLPAPRLQPRSATSAPGDRSACTPSRELPRGRWRARARARPWGSRAARAPSTVSSARS